MKTQELVAHAIYIGDRSVGIPDGAFKIVLHDVDMEMLKQDPDWREHTRDKLFDLAFTVYGEDGLMYVEIEGECPDCGKPGYHQNEAGEWKCVNENCIQNCNEYEY